MFDPLLITGIYLAFIVTIVGVKFTRLKFLLHYGKVLSDKKQNATGTWAKAMNFYSYFEVPKSTFRHYYVAFFAMLVSIPWLQRKLDFKTASVPLTDEAYFSYYTIYSLLMVQAVRRGYETFFVSKFSQKSKISLAHYTFGLGYYVLVAANMLVALAPFEDYKTSTSYLQFLKSYPLTIVAFVVFVAASVDQMQNHIHLASLVKYSAPAFRLFKYVACAHYFDEVIIYVLLAIIALQKTPVVSVDINILADLLFVFTNLYVTSIDCHEYYVANFKDYKATKCIVPGIL